MFRDNEIVIGEGTKGCSAIKCFKIPGDHSISHNSQSYWISHVYGFDINITIFKDSKEGKKLAKLIDDKVTLEIINDWLLHLIFRRTPVDILKREIKSIKKDMFEKGKEAKLKEIKRVLEIGSSNYAYGGYDL